MNNSPRVISDEEELEEAFLYQYVDEESNLLYIYEEIEEEAAVSVVSYDDGIEVCATTDLPDGFGGRQKIKANGSTYISGTIALPSAGTVSASGTPYIYAGFTGGTKEADMGLQWSNNNGGSGTEGWKPYAKVGSTIVSKDSSYYASGYNEVTYKNSYLPGKNVTFYIYSNYNSTGKVRLKTMGYARYRSRTGTGSNTYLTSIIEYSTSVGTPTHFKVLATIAGSEDSKGKFTTTISNIKLNDSAPSSSAYLDVEADSATVTRSGNSVKFVLSK